MDIDMTTKISSWTIIKRFLIFFLPLAILIAVITAVVYSVVVKSEQEIVQNNELRRLENLTQIISQDFTLIVSDLMLLSESYELQALLSSGKNHDRKSLAENFLMFSEKRELYDQIRFIDEKGIEIVRVNFNEGAPAIVPDDQLQNKGNRYYFADSIQLKQREVFVSPLDLNIEHGEIEKPLKPMLRFATPVFDYRDQKRGIVILNYFGAELIQHLEWVSADSSAQIMLLNNDGFWLHSPRPEDEWGFMYEDGQEQKFGNLFPEAWSQIVTLKSGQFHTADGLFTVQTLYPLLEAWESSSGSGEAFSASTRRVLSGEYNWKIISFVPQDVLAARQYGAWSNYILIDIGLLGIILIISILLARATVNREQADNALRESNRNLADARDKAEAADRLKSTFLASMSHELRTPLNSIIGFTGIILQGLSGPLNDEQTKQLNMVRNSGQHLLSLISDVLDISKIEADQLEIEYEPFDMREAIAKVVQIVTPMAEKKGLVLRSEMASGVGQINADQRRVEQILINLVNNGVKFTKQGEVSIQCEVTEDWMVTRVRDTGIGIEPEDIDKLFKPFQQLDDGLARQHDGTGLGLSICKKLTEMMGGEILVESKLGVGTTFTVTLPINGGGDES